MTNTTGAWVVSRVVATDLAGDVSLAVTSTGLARLVFDTLTAVVVYENSTATLAPSASPNLAFVDAALWQMVSAPSGTDLAPTAPVWTGGQPGDANTTTQPGLETGSMTVPILRYGGDASAR